MRKAIYRQLLKLDGAVLKSDSRAVKWLKRNVLKPVGFYFRRKYYKLRTKSYENAGNFN